MMTKLGGNYSKVQLGESMSLLITYRNISLKNTESLKTIASLKN